MKSTVQKMLSGAQIRIGGKNPYDIRVHNDAFYRRVLSDGLMGLGESYVDGWWDCDALDEFIFRALRAGLDIKIKNVSLIMRVLQAKLFNLQSKRRAFIVGEKHYDLGNDLFSAMLDKRMVYTCGYWRNAKTLDTAQFEKLDLVCKKINLKKGQTVLDIGCGWGSFAKFAAEQYGANVVGITISKEQAALAKKMCSGLPVKVRVQDYRDLSSSEKFDCVVSLGMLEHVGPKNYKTYMRVVHTVLKPSGLFLLQTIAKSVQEKEADPWVEKYIFPNGALPSPRDLTSAFAGQLTLEDWHNFGMDYDKTLMAWHNNFLSHWDDLSENYDERFYRLWTYFLLSCAGSFRAKQMHLWQIVLSKESCKRYVSVR